MGGAVSSGKYFDRERKADTEKFFEAEVGRRKLNWLKRLNELNERGADSSGRQGTCALFLITVFISLVVVDVSFLALNHFHAQKYEEGGGTTAVLP